MDTQVGSCMFVAAVYTWFTHTQRGLLVLIKKVAVTFPICHAPAHSIFFPAASYMVE